MRFGPYCLAFVCVALAAVTARGDVWPILKSKCLACHGEDPKGELKGKLDLRSRETALKGGASGKPAIVPGKPEDSLLYVAVTRKDPDLVMPPKENDKLTDRKSVV